MHDNIGVEQSEKPTHECGVCGIYGHIDSSKLAYFGLYALQHRGQESAGIATSTGKTIQMHKDMGLVPEVFSEDILQSLAGEASIGHVRYSTTGSSNFVNTQPLVVSHKGRTIAVAHNGNLTNSITLRDHLESQGSIFQTTMDSEVVLHLLARPSHLSFDEALEEAFRSMKGAYSMLLMTPDKMIAVRDPHGFRPLCMGKLNNGGYIVVQNGVSTDLHPSTHYVL